MKYRNWAAVLAAVAITCAAGEAAARTEPFGQETAELRAPRYQRAKQAPHRQHPGHDHQHAHNHPRGHQHAHDDRHGRDPHDRHFGHDHGIETEFLFGFITGSDVHHQGAKSVSVEMAARVGKRDGQYTALGKKFEFAYGVTDRFNAAIGVAGVHHNINGVTGFANVDNFNFNGIGGEFRWQLIRRSMGSVGVTLHLEPVVQRYDELTGLRGIKYGAENKLIFDTELVKDRLFAAFNVLYEVERVRELGETEWERGSKLGFGFAVAAMVAPNTFLGLNAQYQRAYEGLIFGEFAGEAIYLGPTLYARFPNNTFLSLAWNHQVWGDEVGNPARLDLVNFERNQVRLKAGIEF
jgi:hypothetical protein